MATTSENLQALATAKANIKAAIEGKGQDLTNVPFTQYADKITAIEAGGNSDLLDVDALPAENVDNDKIYRVTDVSKGNFYEVTASSGVTIVARYMEMFNCLDYQQIIVNAINSVTNPLITTSGGVCYVYVDTSTFIGYIWLDGSYNMEDSEGNIVTETRRWTLSEVSFKDNSHNMGVSNGIPSLDGNNVGIFFVVDFPYMQMGVPISSGDKEVFVYDNNTWNNIKDINLPVLQEKTVTEDGDVVADEGYDGLSKVTVNVESKLAKQLESQNNKMQNVLGVYSKQVEPVLYGVKLDKSILTGTEWGSYTDDATELQPAYMDFNNDTFVDNGWYNRFPFNQIKPCLMNSNGEVTGYLNPNDFSQLEDGTPVDIESATSDSVMIEIPKVYYRIARDDNFIYAQISNVAREGFTCDCHVYKGVELDKLYVSAYLNTGENYATSGFKTHSAHAMTSPIDIGYTADCYEAMKQFDGARYEFMPYNVVKMLQCLYIIMFRNTDSQASLGNGYNSAQTTHTSGLLNQKGMCYGTSTPSGIKFLGIEDFYGCRAQIMSGFYLDKSADKVKSRARYIDVYNSNSDYHPDKYTEYLSSQHEFTIGSVYARVAVDVNPDVQISGFYGSVVGTDKTLGFCDNAQPSYSVSSYGEFGMTGPGTANGIFTMKQILNKNTTTSRAARLVYYPEA